MVFKMGAAKKIINYDALEVWVVEVVRQNENAQPFNLTRLFDLYRQTHPQDKIGAPRFNDAIDFIAKRDGAPIRLEYNSACNYTKILLSESEGTCQDPIEPLSQTSPPPVSAIAPSKTRYSGSPSLFGHWQGGR
jgi:hypothetical protein